jgi:DNA-binding MarR family transcriptional regulator
MAEIDFDLVHGLFESKNRIAIMATLAPGDEYDFPALKRELGMTDGNLSSHMARLAEAGLVATKKSGAGKASRTVYKITRAGAAAWDDYIDFLRAVIARGR